MTVEIITTEFDGEGIPYAEEQSPATNYGQSPEFMPVSGQQNI